MNPCRFAASAKLPSIKYFRRLGLTSEAFLSSYTERQTRGRLGLDFLFLRMRDDDKKSCPFLTPQGCSVYSDRPLACRLYPLGLPPPSSVNVNVPVNVAETAGVKCQVSGVREEGGKVSRWQGGKGPEGGKVKDSETLCAFASLRETSSSSFLLIREPHCQGLSSSRLWTVRQWLADQCPGDELAQGREFLEGLRAMILG